jgi:hypothetical protein
MQKELVNSKNPFVRRIGALLAAGALDKHLSLLRDTQIGQLISDVVERDLRIASAEAAICSQASRRLLRSGGDGLHEVVCNPKECPECGAEMLFHVGIDEPDCSECIDLSCQHREFIAEPEAK